MSTVVTALGSNVGDRHRHIRQAGEFLWKRSEGKPVYSSIYLTEPIGPSKRYFLNAVVLFETSLTPQNTLQLFKSYEHNRGRAAEAPRWQPRTIDLDMISYDNLVIQQDNLILPHPEYRRRMFVLLPLQEVIPGWKDPATATAVDELLAEAPAMAIRKTELTW